ncbi:hypothetical protein [Paraglaciecola chathamensis]|uniref:Uncharacterized protein n=1 Tax=Paraglaciecola chathamensis TaxID=368405 RepID=A0A8H9I8F7_9ALTE|nr:hypothetical protein [Paraglaciecola oceanifecundans]GGZ58357.1 hypothetical protein GCM10011274_15360 [Paraglaciecola oceanifecundans]
MAKLQISWDLIIESFSERGEDEVSLQFAMVTAFGGDVRLDPYTTGNLFPSRFRRGLILPPDSTDDDGRRIRAQGMFVVPANVPTIRNPFLGFVARAVEQDSSTDDNREQDNERFYNAVESSAQQIFSAGNVPSATDLWSAGNSANLTDSGWFIFDPDDDDKVSTSARVFPTFGSRLREALVAEPTIGLGGHRLPGPNESFSVTFVGSGNSAGAQYQVNISIHLVTNGGPSSSQSWY